VNKKYRKDNGTGLIINYVDHEVQQKDTHWTGTLRVQGGGADKERPEKEHGMGNANGWKKLERGIKTSLRWIQTEGFHEGPLFRIGTKGQTYDCAWHTSPVTFRHLFYCGTNTCSPELNKSVSSVCRKVAACFTSTSVAYHLPVKCFMRGPQRRKSLGARTGLKGDPSPPSHSTVRTGLKGDPSPPSHSTVRTGLKADPSPPNHSTVTIHQSGCQYEV
jgi:hypothetical protein